jgi:hypothetical protein
MEPNTTFYLELFYQGSYEYTKYGGWTIKAIDMKMQNASHEIMAHIDTSLSPNEEHRLNYRIKEKGNRYSRWEDCEVIGCAVRHIKSMELSARIFQVYEDKTRITSNLSYEKRAMRDDLPIFIEKLPEFEEGKTYQIRIINQGTTLRATVQEKENRLAEDLLKEVNELKIKPEYDLNVLETAELVKLLEESEKRLSQAWDLLLIAMKIGKNDIPAWETQRQISQETRDIAVMLFSRGVSLDYDPCKPDYCKPNKT